MLVPFALSLLVAAPIDPVRSAAADVPAGEIPAITQLLNHGLHVGNPFPTRDTVMPPQTDENAAKARSIARLAVAARARALDRSPDVVRAVEAIRQVLLAEKLMQSLTDAIVIDENEVRRRFDASPDKYDEFEMAHIFFSSAKDRGSGGADAGERAALARATAVQNRLKAGENFEVVAGSSSDDGSSAVEGGHLPAVLGANIQPAFLDVVRTMKEGATSGIVKGDQGYHIIRLLRRSHAWSGPARVMIEGEIRSREMLKLLPELRQLEAAAK